MVLSRAQRPPLPLKHTWMSFLSLGLTCSQPWRVGALVGLVVGLAVGALVGLALGLLVGLAVGDVVGDAVGLSVGLTVGTVVGLDVGDVHPVGRVRVHLDDDGRVVRLGQAQCTL